MSKLTSSFLWAFFACLISMGTLLLPQYTISPRMSVPGITRVDDCLLGDTDWHCISIHYATPQLDSGAPAFQELPAAIFLNQNMKAGMPRPDWNPYIGSGYPMALDGIQRAITPSYAYMTRFPGDKARDYLVFFRFLVWTTGIVYTLTLLGVSGFYLFVVGLLATLIPYVSTYVDIVYLDIDMVSPWIFALFLQLMLGVVSARRTYLAFAFLGFWIGIQSFVQTQTVFALVTAITSVFLWRRLRVKTIYALLSFSVPFLILALPHALKFKHYFSELVSNRTFLGCIATFSGISWADTWHTSIEGLFRLTTETSLVKVCTLPGIFLILWLAKTNRTLRPFIALYGFLTLWFIVGAPSLACHFQGLSAIAFLRYLMPYFQGLFLSLTAFTIYTISKKFTSWRSAALAAFLIFLALLPFSAKHLISVNHFKNIYAKALNLNPEPIPETSVYKKIRELSIDEDRRHYAPDGRLAPNLSQQFQIMDLRVLYGVYPRRLWTMNDAVTQSWTALPVTGRPDRFVGSDLEAGFIPLDFEKAMVINRVSLLSFSKNKRWLERGQFYSEKICRKLGEDFVAVSYLCPAVEGVGYFPKSVVTVNEEHEALKVIKKWSTAEALSAVVIESPQALTPSNGDVISFVRTPNDLSYVLNVKTPGVFVVADTFFEGWSAKVNGVATPILAANVGFKAVVVPQGHVKVDFHFTF